MRSEHEQRIINAFLKIYSQHQNPIWTSETLDYLVLEKHKEEFKRLSDEEQWEIRNLLGAIARLYR